MGLQQLKLLNAFVLGAFLPSASEILMILHHFDSSHVSKGLPLKQLSGIVQLPADLKVHAELRRKSADRE